MEQAIPGSAKVCEPASGHRGLSKARNLPLSMGYKYEKAALLALAGSASLALISVAASQILLAGALFASIGALKRKEVAFPRLPFIIPLIAFFVWTIVAALASPDAGRGLTIVKKFYLFLPLLLVPLVARGAGRIIWIYRTVFAFALVSSAMGLAQFVANPHRDLTHRISGFMSQWMTYSGLLMLALVLLSAYTLGAGLRGHKWVIPLGAFLILALILSETRNAWMGAIAGIFVLVLIRRPRAVAGLLAAILAIYLAAPTNIKQRFRSGWDPEDPNTRNRIELFGTSVRLIRDNPWFGVGPKNVPREALRYRGNNDFPDWLYLHMHNNFFQIAAERGIPGLIIWLWFMARLAWDALCVYRSAKNNATSGRGEAGNEALIASTAALGAWVALLIAGMAEYNFGDSEVLTLFLFIMSAPYAFLDASKVAIGADPRESGPKRS